MKTSIDVFLPFLGPRLLLLLRRVVPAECWRNSRNETDRNKYTYSRRTIKKIIEKKKQDLEEKNWKWRKKANIPKNFGKQYKNTSIDINEEQWLTHFKQFLEADNDSEAETKANDTSDKEMEEQRTDQNKINMDISEKEVIKEIQKMKNGKAPGEDGIINEFYKNLPKEAIIGLATTINELWKRGELGVNWNKGKIFPIF